MEVKDEQFFIAFHTNLKLKACSSLEVSVSCYNMLMMLYSWVISYQNIGLSSQGLGFHVIRGQETWPWVRIELKLRTLNKENSWNRHLFAKRETENTSSKGLRKCQVKNNIYCEMESPKPMNAQTEFTHHIVAMHLQTKTVTRK